MDATVDARPTKRFFIDNLTRDLSLEDAILDLVDNSIDALIRANSIDISPSLLAPHAGGGKQPPIKITFTKSKFVIEDRSGGIDLEHARHHVFRFGRPPGSYAGSLGVYGIGLKRAIFKIGRIIEFVSRTSETGFRVFIEVDKWADDDHNWTLPFEEIEPATSPTAAGTTISITEINDDVALRLGDGTLLTRLSRFLANTYSLFLDRHASIALNGQLVAPQHFPLASAELLSPNVKPLSFKGVQLDLVAGLADREDDEWNAERAGWYVLCNGRVVVDADKTELTGWGVSGPQFVSKYRGFLGIAFFYSAEPASLPWNTTKRGLNRDAHAYQVARKEMAALGRPVLNFLNSMYVSEPAERKTSRELVKTLVPADLSQVVKHAKQDFASNVPREVARSTTIRVQFDAARADVTRIKKHLSKPRWSAGAVGHHAFEHFLRTECPE